MAKKKHVYEEVKQMEMKVLGFNIFPLVIWIFNLMPDSWRKSLISKKNAPRQGSGPALKDIFDLTGESPYEKEEIVPGRLWVVTHMKEEAGVTRQEKKRQVKALGWDPTSTKFQERCLEGAAPRRRRQTPSSVAARGHPHDGMG